MRFNDDSINLHELVLWPYKDPTHTCVAVQRKLGDAHKVRRPAREVHGF